MNVTLINSSLFNSSLIDQCPIQQGSELPLLPIFFGCVATLAVATRLGVKLYKSYFAPETTSSMSSDPNCRFHMLPKEISRMIFVQAMPLNMLDEENQTWVSVAKGLGWDDISGQATKGKLVVQREPGQVKKEVMYRVNGLLKSIKGVGELEGVPPDISAVLNKPLTVESLNLLLRWKKARDTLKIWDKIAFLMSLPKPSSWGNGQNMINEAEGKGAYVGRGFANWFSTHNTVLQSSITELFLINSSLSTIPSEIFTLCNITSINLAYNDFAIIPPEIKNLTYLDKLVLSNNQIPTLPREIGSLKGLKKLALKGNPLVSLPPEVRSFQNGTVKIDRFFYFNLDQLIDEYPSSYKSESFGTLSPFLLCSEM